MGRGLALAFKRRYPAHFASYRRACRAGALRPGACPRFLVALPTKRHWRDPARLDDVERSVRALADALRERSVASVAIPKLGCGLGGLAWPDVHRAIAQRGAHAMSRITFKRMSREESRIYQDGDYIGDVYRQDDILTPGAHYYLCTEVMID